MEVHGYSSGDQATGELLMKAYASDDWQPILDFCTTADFFQDLPFSAPKTAAVLRRTFPDAKYILTTRSSAEEWYRSITGFHKLMFGAGEVPTKEDLQKAEYRYPGFAWDASRSLYNTPEHDPYNRPILKMTYRDHIKKVEALFSGSDQLLRLDIADPKAVEKLCAFLGIDARLKEMPWLNRTSDREK